MVSIASPTTPDRKVDHSALRTNQVFIIGLTLLAFVLNAPILIAFVAAVMLIGTLYPQAGLFKLFYFNVLKPNNIAKPDVKLDNPEPHLFAQLVGGLFLAAATVTFLIGASLIGWILGWVVIALASLNLFAGICVGCIMYYQLNRLGVTGFTHAPIQRGSV